MLDQSCLLYCFYVLKIYECAEVVELHYWQVFENLHGTTTDHLLDQNVEVHGGFIVSTFLL